MKEETVTLLKVSVFFFALALGSLGALVLAHMLKLSAAENIVGFVFFFEAYIGGVVLVMVGGFALYESFDRALSRVKETKQE